MKNFLKQLINLGCNDNKKIKTEETDKQNSRKELEIKVEKGAERAFNEYRGAFKKLAEYDRS